ncbi:deoxyribose-phosphate aldolase [Candidatus Bipolaricaulota bacterium]|nr:deoxyribose-phosphate aldolase [Candidatus Bipolaricaulota bacterium]
MLSRRELAKRIDHTLLGQTASTEGVKKLCQEAVEYGVASVCVNPCHATLAKGLLADSDVLLCIVVGFPHGMSLKETKAFEAQKAIAAGADELDMVINVAALKEGDLAWVENDMRAVCSVAEKAPRSVDVKVILEMALLTEEEKVAGATITKSAGAQFAKTSTGFASGGATLEDVALLRKTVGDKMGVKAAGGIRDAATAQAMIDAGASRIGASRTVEILDSIE